MSTANGVNKIIDADSASPNGIGAGPEGLFVGNGDGISLDRFAERLMTNSVMSRAQLIQRMLDPRRNVDQECGYPDMPVDSTKYLELFETEAIPARVVQVYPFECWQVQPLVYEEEDSSKVTPFEESWDALGLTLRGESSWYQDEEGSLVWEYLQRLDEVAGIGRYGVALLGIDDDLSLDKPATFINTGGMDRAALSNDSKKALGPTQAKPLALPNPTPAAVVKPTPPPGPTPSVNATAAEIAAKISSRIAATKMQAGTTRKLLFIRCFPESMAKIIERDEDPRSPRFNQPLFYEIQLDDPRGDSGASAAGTASGTKVHWSRVIHVADNMVWSEVCGMPRMQQVLRRLLDLKKLHGGSAEMYWQGAFPGLSLETHPQLGGDVKVNTEKVKDAMERYYNGLQRYLQLMGMSAKSLAPQVVDPTQQIMVQIEAICILLGIPKRVFMGTERGELASSQDDKAWNDRLKRRQGRFITPRIIIPFVDRLISMGVLARPRSYRVWWPDVTSQGTTEKVAMMTAMVDAIVKYIGAGADIFIAPIDFLTRILWFSEEEANAIIHNAQKIIEQRQEEEQKQQAEMLKLQAQLDQQAADNTPPNDGGGGGNPPPANGNRSIPPGTGAVAAAA